MSAKNDLITIDEILETLYKKRDFLNQIKDEAVSASSNKSKRRIKALFYLIFAQMAFTQYGTYVKYSWDILEPICCLFGIFDAFVAYAFWMRHNRDFDYETFEVDYLNERISVELGRQIKFDEEMKDIELMISHMEVWNYLQSDDMPDILEALDQKYKVIPKE